ncbi:MAG TPA: pyruvate kinase, partial [Xanthomonadales bacterium]|nr:pyruvate kinase [Xanthomonadales bacterium]
MTQQRRTKIIATLGPATDQPGVLEKIIHEGVDVVRINLSHGGVEDHRRR